MPRIRKRPALGLKKPEVIPHPEVNGLGLSLREREVALDVLRSFAACLTREVTILCEEHLYRWDSAYPEGFNSVYNSAIRQLRGTARTGAFELQREVPEEDMAYVMESLEESLRGAALARELFLRSCNPGQA